ncbi:TPA: hypothetical protein MCD20_004878, partial [Klebsiella pneumoniae]
AEVTREKRFPGLRTRKPIIVATTAGKKSGSEPNMLPGGGWRLTRPTKATRDLALYSRPS